MTNHTKMKEDVEQVHELFWQAYADRALDLRFSLMADDITFIGTGLHERAHNKEEYRLMNQKGVDQYPGKFKIEFIWKNTSTFETTAWVESEGVWIQVINGIEIKELIRNTVILRFVNDQWLIAHVHGSVPDYRLKDGDYMTSETTIIRNKELEQQVYERTQELHASLENLKATQALLIQSEKMASLGELTAGIAHEIQNPLNFVNNFSEINTELINEMQAELQKGNPQQAIDLALNISENEEKINYHGKRAETIVKGMLQHSRAGTGVKEPTQINALIDEYVRLAYHGLRAKDKTFNAQIQTDFDESIGSIHAVPQEMGRVVLNLITNAFYAVAEKSKLNIPDYQPTVNISTKRITSDAANAGQQKSSPSMEIVVRDNGNGIPSKIVDKIFQPFFTTKPTGKGTGLGLSMSYDIIQAHQGSLKVNAKEGEFAEFIITLPI